MGDALVLSTKTLYLDLLSVLDERIGVQLCEESH